MLNVTRTKRIWGLVLAVLLFLPVAGSAQPASKHVNVWIFSAPWCPLCRLKLPGLLQTLDQKLGDDVGVVIHIESGTRLFSVATQQDADAFQKTLNTRYPVVPDAGWVLYHQFFTKYFLPAVVVVDENGSPLKVFDPSIWDKDDVASFAASQLAR